jgi:hypothetical protein
MKHNRRDGSHDQALDKWTDLFLDPTDRNLAKLTGRVLYRDAYGRWTKVSCVSMAAVYLVYEWQYFDPFGSGVAVVR